MNETTHLTLKQRDSLAAILGAPVMRNAHRTRIDRIGLRAAGLIDQHDQPTRAGYSAADAAGLLARYDDRATVIVLRADMFAKLFSAAAAG